MNGTLQLCSCHHASNLMKDYSELNLDSLFWFEELSEMLFL